MFNARGNKKTEDIIDQYIACDRDRYSLKAAYVILDTIKVIGTGEINPAALGIFYDNLKTPRIGGTAHTIKVCENNCVPVIDQKIWLSRLKE